MTNEVVNAIEQAYLEGYEDAKKKYARPQGEWEIDTETRIMKCNRCRATENANRLLVDEMNFCYHCGADLRGSENEA